MVLRKLLVKLGLAKWKARVVVVGLNNVGKTSIVSTLHGHNEDVVPTVGFSIEKFVYNKVKLTVMDMSGQTQYRELWEHYFKEAQAVIFVLDAADRSSTPEAAVVLQKLLQHIDLQGAPLLVFANKTDLPEAMVSHEVAAELDLVSLKGRTFHIQPCSALRREGIEDGMKWLFGQLHRKL